MRGGKEPARTLRIRAGSASRFRRSPAYQSAGLPNMPPSLLRGLVGLGLAGILRRVVRHRRGSQPRLHGLDSIPRRGLNRVSRHALIVALVGRHDGTVVAQVSLVCADILAILPDVPLIGSNV